MNSHSPESGTCSADYDTEALIIDMREIFRRQTRTFMLTLLVVTLLHMTSTVVAHAWL